MDHTPLKLRAIDSEAMHILSSYLQDALFPLSSMHVNFEKGTFSCLMNRFCFEHADDFDKYSSYYRVHVGFSVQNVVRMQTRNFDHLSSHRVFNLLTIKVDNSEAGKSFLCLLFSADREIRLEVSSVYVQMNDVGLPWPTPQKPIHIYEHLEAFEKVA